MLLYRTMPEYTCDNRYAYFDVDWSAIDKPDENPEASNLTKQFDTYPDINFYTSVYHKNMQKFLL
ncbi:Uncharacterized protein dnm_100070 [Desulfonema magnum]|uniref:Uncharacterized protein n=1 Tax=Desulfonema magnum TaxID=45655 RepID=A0A975GU79_9BACT|nr:Uncharacterized protein dnm_100070 [Desulfonema magnum]